jgi:hypothetical protein
LINSLFNPIFGGLPHYLLWDFQSSIFRNSDY